MALRTARYGVYFVPRPESPLAAFGAHALGRDMGTDQPAPLAPLAGLDDAARSATAVVPARYGFHATLKPPFHLAPGARLAELESSLSRLAARLPAVVLPPMRVDSIDDFVALRPSGHAQDLAALSATCVIALDAFRAAPGDAELQKRRQGGLQTDEERLLTSWGYPHLFWRYRFHMTLTDRLPRAQCRKAVHGFAKLHAEEADDDERIEELTLVEQPEPFAPFRVRRRYPLGGQAATGRLVLVVGPSGVGKDSLMAGARRSLPAERFYFPRRSITRPVEAGAEIHEALTPDEFARLEASGCFALSWEAHGFSYGIPREVSWALRAGMTCVINASRQVVDRARSFFPDLRIVHVVADPATVAGRLQMRGRENGTAIAERLAREASVPNPGDDATVFPNDAPLLQTAPAFVALLGRL